MTTRWRTIPKLLGRAVVNFVKDGCLDRSAAVAFYALLSLGPFLYLVGLFLRRVLLVRDPQDAALSGISAFVPGPVGPALQTLGASLPARGGIAVLALPALLWVATSAFTALDAAVHAAFGTAAERSFWRSKGKAFAATSGLTLLLTASLVANQWGVWLDRYRERIGLPPALGPRAAWAPYSLLLLIAFSSFVTFYKLLPGGRVRWSAASAGAGVALALWEAARRAFGAALSASPGFGMATGTLAGVLAFLLWIYVSVAVCLLGAEIAALADGRRDPADPQAPSRPAARA